MSALNVVLPVLVFARMMQMLRFSILLIRVFTIINLDFDEKDATVGLQLNPKLQPPKDFHMKDGFVPAKFGIGYVVMTTELDKKAFDAMPPDALISVTSNDPAPKGADGKWSIMLFKKNLEFLMDTTTEGKNDDKDQNCGGGPPSNPPMPPVPKPKDPKDRKYKPEGNTGGGGGVGPDPQCKQVFEPIGQERMKRGETSDMFNPGGPDGYEAGITKTDTETIPLRKVPEGDKYQLYTGRMDCEITMSTPTPIFMPDNGTYITAYKDVVKGTDVVFEKDGLDNVYVRAVSGGYRTITLDYSVYCKVQDNGQLLYYRQDYDGNMTVFDAYKAGKTIGFNSDKSVHPKFRRNVPKMLEIIDKDYFSELISELSKSPTPGMGVVASLDGVRMRYNFKDVITKIATYTLRWGCDKIPPSVPGDMLMSCITSRIGSCRHRALAFFIIANTIGIPTRYCASDCHAYVEVWFGNVNRWVGIDLGGCSPPQPEDKGGKGGKDGEKKSVVELLKESLMAKGWKEGEERLEIAIRKSTEMMGGG